jgi:hypothetical protein
MARLGVGMGGRGTVVRVEGAVAVETIAKGVIGAQVGLRCAVKTGGKDGNCLKAKGSRSVA